MHISNLLPAFPTYDLLEITPPVRTNTPSTQQCPPTPRLTKPNNPVPTPPLTTPHPQPLPEPEPPPPTQNALTRNPQASPHPESTKTSTENLTNQQSTYPQYQGHMCPNTTASHHPAFNLLLQYATTGCPADCGPKWTKDHIEAAIRWGPHPSARTPAAATALRQEALQKVTDGTAHLVNWTDIQHNIPPNLKVSPLATVPHKSCQF